MMDMLPSVLLTMAMTTVDMDMTVTMTMAAVTTDMVPVMAAGKCLLTAMKF